MSEDRAPIEQLLDLVLYGPLGVARDIHRRLPDYVRDGREQAEQQVVLARFIGQMAVKIGRQELLKRVAELRQQTGEAGPPPAADEQPDEEHGGDTAEPTEPAPEPTGIHGYATLSASQLVERLEALTDDELDAVERYEAENRRRRTVLTKIDQIRDLRSA